MVPSALVAPFLAFGREPFLAEVTGNRLSKDALDRLVAARSPTAS
jgi:hypothetical protein